MATDMEIPADWQVSELSSTVQQTVWLVQQPLQPSFDAWDCDAKVLPKVGVWCDSAGARWVLQNFNGSYWLTRLATSRAALASTSTSWLGTLLQEITNEPYRLRVYQTRHHPKQLLGFLRLRQANRKAQLVRLSTAQYYLLLQRPLEWILLQQIESGFLSLHYQTTRASNS